MKTYSQEELTEHYDKLPEILKDAMYSSDIASKMVAVGKKFGLTIEKIGIMAEQTGYIVLGLVRPGEFIQILADALGIGADKASEIAKEINSQVLYPLREALKATHQIEISEIESVPRPSAGIPAAGSGLGRIQNQELRTVTPQAPAQESRSMKQELREAETDKIKPVPPPTPVDLGPKPTPVAESKFFDKFAAPKAAPPPLKVSLPQEERPLPPKPPAPPAQPPPTPLASADAKALADKPEGKAKIPPLDLRKVTPPTHKAMAGKSERMREAIFAPPIEPEEKPKETPAPE
ncbi:MAG: hypothetical protein HYW91_03165, partial [Candidatus Sungbacteria bacterium]|nr:hypothetical protein [Candidatus Sungbacteria bacterium]